MKLCYEWHMCLWIYNDKTNEYTKGLIRSRQSNKDRKYNIQKRKDNQNSTKHYAVQNRLNNTNHTKKRRLTQVL